MTQQASTPDALIDRLRGGVYGLNRIALCEEAAAELRRQHAEIERLRADAARYRWLTTDGERIGERMRGTLDAWDGCDGKAGFDVAIDAAMRDAL